MSIVVGGLNKPTILNSTSDDDNQIAILWLFALPSTSSILIDTALSSYMEYTNIARILTYKSYLYFMNKESAVSAGKAIENGWSQT